MPALLSCVAKTKKCFPSNKAGSFAIFGVNDSGGVVSFIEYRGSVIPKPCILSVKLCVARDDSVPSPSFNNVLALRVSIVP